MNKTVLLAKANGVTVGAHPSLPDLQGFGRREMAIEPVRLGQLLILLRYLTAHSQEELEACFIYQVGALSGFLVKYGMQMHHVRAVPSFLTIQTHAYFHRS